MKLLKYAFAMLLLHSAQNLKAQHCRYDGSMVLVLDIRNKDTNLPVPNLDIKLIDKDSIEYYQPQYSYTKDTKYPTYKSEYMKFSYVTQAMMDEGKKETNYGLPKSVLHKYILWLGPSVYRNAFYKNIVKKLYLQDMAMINIKKDGLTRGAAFIKFEDNIKWNGCTTSDLWDDKPSFQTIYFNTEEIGKFEKRTLND